ncbi:MAG: AEC family transporter [Planctomycetia bacterium]|nr:AEC family transporter [Planctomycetia bacterium]
MFNNFQTPFNAVVAVYTVIVLGMICRKCGAFSRETTDSVLKLVVNVLTPCLIASKTLSNPAFSDIRNIIYPPLTGMAVILIGLIVGLFYGFFLSGQWTGLKNRQQICTFAVCVGMLNYGYVPIPLIQDLYPGDNRLLAVLFMQNIGTEFMLWTFCVFILMGSFSWETCRRIINVPACAILGTMILNITGYDACIPELAMKPVCIVGESTIPMSLFFAGASIIDFWDLKGGGSFKQTFQLAFGSSLIRLLILPFLIILLAKYVPCSRELKIVLVVHASMASAVFPIILARIYNGDVKTAITTVLSNSLLALATTPLWIAFGLKYLNL